MSKPEIHELKVQEVRKETDDTVSVSFIIPESLESKYRFVQGQYLTVIKEFNGEEIRRSYSICTSPNENDLRVAVKLVEGGKFSTYANHELKSGDTLKVMTPMGNFYTDLDEKNKKNYVAFAAGSGITPIMSIMKTTLIKEPQSTFTLFYGNKGVGNIIFKEEIDGLKNLYLDRLSVYHVLSREKMESDFFGGRITAEKCDKFLESLINIEEVDEVFLCGPGSMIESVTDLLKEKGIPKENIHYELFTSPSDRLKPKLSKKQSSEETHKELKSKVTVVVDGMRTSFSLSSEDENILDAALKNGADLPYACKGGVCSTCRSKVVKGEVEMDVNYSLEEEELEAGFVLACQAHPQTKEVVLDFDEK